MTTTTKQTPTDDVVYASGEFTGDDGKKRRRYDAIGAAWRGEDGQITRLKISTIPVTWDGNLYFRSRSKPEASGAA